MKTINWGIIGCGDVTEIKSGPAYKLTEGFNLIAVMRRNVEKAKDYAQRHNIDEYYSDADELINNPNIHAVYIATPPDTHKFYALKVAKAGKICCIEKPMSPNYADSLDIYKAFKDKNLPLFIAYYRRSLPRFLKIKEWLDAKEIGVIRHINWQFSKPISEMDISRDYNWRTDVKIAPGGYFDDLASHGIDLFNYFLGNITEVKGFSLNQENYYTAKDAFVACWMHDKNITGSASWNFNAFESLDDVCIYGSEGYIKFSIFHDNPVILKNSKKSEKLFIENPKHIQINHVESMRNHLMNSQSMHPSSGLTGLHTNWVLDKILNVI